MKVVEWLVVAAVVIVLIFSVQTKNEGKLEVVNKIAKGSVTTSHVLAAAIDHLNATHGCCVSVLKVMAVEREEDTDRVNFTIDLMLYYKTEYLDEQKLQRLFLTYDANGVRVTNEQDVSNVPLATIARNTVQRKRWLLRKDPGLGLLYIDRNDPLYIGKETIYVQLKSGEVAQFKNITPGHPQYGRVGTISYDPRETYQAETDGSSSEFVERRADDSQPYPYDYPITDAILSPAPEKIVGSDLDLDILANKETPPLSKLQGALNKESILNIQYGY